MMEDNFDGVSMIDLIRKDEAMQIKDAFVVRIHVFVLPFIPFQVKRALFAETTKKQFRFMSVTSWSG